MRRLLVILLVLFAPVTFAQTVRNCVTVTCNVVSDPFPPAPAVQPTQCQLLDAGVLVVTTPVTGSPPICNFPNRNYAAGTHTLTAKAVAADGSTSAASNSVVFTSSTGAPPVPTNVRLSP